MDAHPSAVSNRAPGHDQQRGGHEIYGRGHRPGGFLREPRERFWQYGQWKRAGLWDSVEGHGLDPLRHGYRKWYTRYTTSPWSGRFAVLNWYTRYTRYTTSVWATRGQGIAVPVFRQVFCCG